MADKGKEPLLKPWEAGVLVLPVVLLVITILLEYFHFNRIITTVFFVILPFSFGVGIVILDFVRSRLTARGWRWR